MTRQLTTYGLAAGHRAVTLGGMRIGEVKKGEAGWTLALLRSSFMPELEEILLDGPFKSVTTAMKELARELADGEM